VYISKTVSTVKIKVRKPYTTCVQHQHKIKVKIKEHAPAYDFDIQK